MLGFALDFAAAPYVASHATDFANVPDAVQYSGSLSYGDLDGDPDSDVCIRRADGVYCATNNAGSFSSYGRRLAAFRRSGPLRQRLERQRPGADPLDGDSHRDVCLRGALAPASGTGLYCALAP